MNARKVAGIVLLALGILALVYGGFSYTKESHEVGLGPLQFEMKEQEEVNVPVWLGVALAVGGGLLLVIPAKR